MADTVSLEGFGSGGGTGATLTVTAPAGCTVTISKDGKSRTKTADSAGKAVFKGIKSGSWTVTISNGEDTATKTVSVNTDYSVSMGFYTLPVLNSSYPQDVTQAIVGGSATFKVTIATAGVPASYTYQWYVNGSAVSGATSASYTRSNLALGTYSVYCKVTNAAGTVQSRTATLIVTYKYFYKAGDQCTSVTGGWNSNLVKSSYLGQYDWFETTPSLKIGKDDGANEGQAICYTKKSIDMTDLSSVVFKISFGGDTDEFYPKVGIASTTSIDFTDANGFVAYKSITSTGAATITVDVSSLNGSYYVALGGYKGQAGTITATEIYGVPK